MFKAITAILLLRRELERRESERVIIFQAINRMSNNHAKGKLLKELSNVGITEENKKIKNSGQRH